MTTTYGFTQIYNEQAAPTTLNATIALGDNSLTLVDATNWPSPTNSGSTRERALFALDYGDKTGKLEICRYNARTGTTLNGVERGLFGTTAQAHTAGGQIRHILSGHDMAEFFLHQYQADHYSETKNVLNPAGATPAINLLTGTNWDLTLSANATLSISNVNGTAGTLTSLLILIRNGATAYTMTWPTSFKWAGGSTPGLSGINKADLVSAVSFDGGTTFAASIVQNFSGLG